MDNASEFYHIRNALLEAALADYQDAAALPPEAPAFSPRYRRWEKMFLRDPFASLHRGRLGRKRALRLALCAAILLAVSVGTVVLATPGAQKAIGQWAFQAYEDHNSYRFLGRGTTGERTDWVPNFLPDGYTQENCYDLGNLVDIFYVAKDPKMRIHFSYQQITNGTEENLDNEHYRISSISIHGMQGYQYIATDDSPNILLWFDTDAGYSFLLASRLPIATLKIMAENVAPVEK